MAMDRMYDSAVAFERALDALADAATDNASQVIRKTLIDLWQGIVDMTPVDTGRLRAGWSLSPNFDPTDKPAEGEASYPVPKPQDPGHAQNWNWNLYNNIEYASVIEDGHSQQAPQGMVAANLQSFADHLRKNLQGSEYWDDA
jgi:hypothetical protein